MDASTEFGLFVALPIGTIFREPTFGAAVLLCMVLNHISVTSVLTRFLLLCGTPTTRTERTSLNGMYSWRGSVITLKAVFKELTQFFIASVPREDLRWFPWCSGKKLCKRMINVWVNLMLHKSSEWEIYICLCLSRDLRRFYKHDHQCNMALCRKGCCICVQKIWWSTALPTYCHNFQMKCLSFNPKNKGTKSYIWSFTVPV